VPVTAKTYEQLALEDSDHIWELHCGRLVDKPPMTFAHNDVAHEIGFALHAQLDRRQFVVRINASRAKRGESTYYVPDVSVIPVALTEGLRGRMDVLEAYDRPLSLVIEVWSPSTGRYDVDEKLPEYQRRGDLEIWRIHPYERTLTAWVRQLDGVYTETLYRSGMVQPESLPGVTIDLDRLWES
jgi:Uma2 family endonuclease